MVRTCAYWRSAVPLTLVLASTSLPVSAADATDEPSTSLETIVVTAEKREENLQTVPVAVTAFTGQTLTEIAYEDFSNLNGLAPGLSVRETVGGSLQATFTMRGVYATAAPGADSGVALYVDGMYLSETTGSDMDLADIERIEVLRGPQGTLFGRNSIGGAISVITKEPTGKFDLHQELAYGNLQQIRSKTRIDTPAWNGFSLSMTFLHDQMQGDVRNTGANTVWNWGPATGGNYGALTSPSTLGGHDTNAVGTALKYDSDLFKAIYRFNYSHKIYTPEATGILTFNTGPGGAFLSGLFQGFWQAENPSIRTPISSTRPDAVNNWFTTPTLDVEQTHNLTITAPIGNHVSIKDVLAWREVKDDSTTQLDGLGGLYIAPTVPLLPLINDNHSFQKSLQEELDVNIDTEFVKSTVGYMYYYSRVTDGGFINSQQVMFGSGLFPGVPTFSNFTAQAVPGVRQDDIRLMSHALYTQNEIHIAPKLDLVLGSRITSDHRSGLDNSPTPASPGVPVTYNKNTPTYLAGLDYQLTDDVLAYAKWSTGYITGGRLANIPFQPETAKSFEIGVKSELLDRTLRLNLALFTAKYDNVQVLTNPSAGCANVPGVALTAAACVVSGGNEKANGVEAEIEYVVVDGLTLGGNMSYTHVSLSDVPADLVGPDGSYVAVFLPPWTGSLSAQYRGHSMQALAGSHVAGRIDADYVSSAFGSTPNSVASVSDAAKIPARTIVNGRLGLAGFDFGGAEVEVAAFVKNLTNNKSIIYSFNGSLDVPVLYQFARTYGISLMIDF